MREGTSLVLLGAGGRGQTYADLAVRHVPPARLVALAEPRDHIRTIVGDRHGVPEADRVADWRELADRPRLADAVVIALPDAEHRAATEAFADRGYQILLEKPMATTEQDCVAIADAAARNDVTVTVAHVMRYSSYSLALKRELHRIGDIVSIQHLEPIGFYHFAHSYVRGNWRRESDSTFLLMAKSCHDIDWIRDLVGRPVSRVSSFGSLSHFRPQNAPPGAAARCVDCVVESTCPYSAMRMYGEGLAAESSDKHYFTRVATAERMTGQGLRNALQDSPYGRCVYHCDNDVVDHQVVNLEFDNGITVSFTLTAFTPMQRRQTKVFGTRGQLTGDGRCIEVFDFLTEQTAVIDTDPGATDHTGGHLDADAALIDTFLDALGQGRPELLVTGVQDSLASHRIVFAAEQARRTGQVVTLSESADEHIRTAQWMPPSPR
jgi:predicted dehydrogenase